MRLGCALVATMSGLVLGLLTTSAKSTFDSERDETKALGQLNVVVLIDANEIGRAAADLAGVGGHARAWDSVTETYSLRIPLSIDPPPGRTLVVQATFEGVDGARMTATREVRWPETAR